MTTTHDLHVVDTRPLIPPALLHRDLPIDPTALKTVATARSRIQAILGGLDQLAFNLNPSEIMRIYRREPE